MNQLEFSRRLFEIYRRGICLDCPPYASPEKFSCMTECGKEKVLHAIRKNQASLLALLIEANVSLDSINEAIRKSSRCWKGPEQVDFLLICGGKLRFGHCLSSEQFNEVVSGLLK